MDSYNQYCFKGPLNEIFSIYLWIKSIQFAIRQKSIGRSSKIRAFLIQSCSRRDQTSILIQSNTKKIYNRINDQKELAYGYQAQGRSLLKKEHQRYSIQILINDMILNKSLEILYLMIRNLFPMFYTYQILCTIQQRVYLQYKVIYQLTSTHTCLLVKSIISTMQTPTFDPNSKGAQLQNEKQSIQQPNFKLLDSQSQILLRQVKVKRRYFHMTQKDSITRSSSKKLSSLLAGKKARQRKKAYLTNLQQNVQDLQQQIRKYDDQIKKAKQTLTQALNSQKNNQNAYTFSELKFSVQTDDPNYDKINLLLDMIKFRIGASGKQRQAKIDYFFKQVINALFPALHRYMMHTSQRQVDLFQEKDIFQSLKETKQSQQVKESVLSWTKLFLHQLQLSQVQKNLIFQKKETFVKRKSQTRKIIQRLNIVKWRIKDEEVVIEDLIDDIRKCMTPVQAGTWAIFAEKYNLQSQLTLIGDYHPVKKIKPNQSQM